MNDLTGRVVEHIESGQQILIEYYNVSGLIRDSEGRKHDIHVTNDLSERSFKIKGYKLLEENPKELPNYEIF